MKNSFWLVCTLAIFYWTSGHAMSGTLISDGFETDSSADYTIATQAVSTGTVTFAFDYVAAGIPLAPRSSPGTSRGVKITVNEVIDEETGTGINDTKTLFHNTPIEASVYKLTVDVFMNFTGVSGTTEHAHVGVGGNGVTPNALFTPITGSGSFLAFTGDGGSASDYRWFLAGANGGPTTVPNSDPSYLGHGSNNTGAFYTAFFPSPPSTVAGSPGNIWTTVEVLVDNVNGRIQYFMTNTEGTRELFIDNKPESLDPPATGFTGVLQGLVSIGLHDAFLSVAPATVFTVFDNLVVEEVVTGATVEGSFVNHGSYSGAGSAIDSGKSLVQEGNGPTLLTYNNLINTARGINGVAFDIQGLGNAGSLSAADFVFQMSPQGAFDEGANPPSGWASAPAPASVTVTPGSPDRVLVSWADNSIENRWLRVTISANANTGLASPQTYYLGHLRGETTGPPGAAFTVAFADITPIRAAVGQTVDSSSIADIDKNGTVAFSDISAMRSNVGSQLTIITVP